MDNREINKVFGIIAIGISALLLFTSLYLLLYYSDLLYCCNCLYTFAIFPNWMLLINAAFGIIGIFISILLYKEKIRFRLFLILILLIWILAFVSYGFPII